MPTPTSANTIILNACLTMIHSLMLTVDRFKVREEILAAFDLDALKSAREALFSFVVPGGPGFRGANHSSDREKCIQCFESIYTKMSEVDATEVPVIFACPSRDLHLLPRKSAQNDSHAACTEKINQLHSHLQQQIDAIIHSSRSFTAVDATGRSADAPRVDRSTPLRPRSESVKRKNSSEGLDDSLDKSVYEDAQEQGFTFQRDYRRKLARREGRSDVGNTVIPSVTGLQLPIQRNQSSMSRKRPDTSITGKGQSSTSGFKGVPPKPRYIPQVFIFRCDSESSTEEKVKAHLLGEHIKVLQVKQVSREGSFFKSFRVTVEKKEDFDKLMTGNHVPQYVKVRAWHYSPKGEGSEGSGAKPDYFRAWEDRSPVDTITNYNRQVQELAELERQAVSGGEAMETVEPSSHDSASSDPIDPTPDLSISRNPDDTA